MKTSRLSAKEIKAKGITYKSVTEKGNAVILKYEVYAYGIVFLVKSVRFRKIFSVHARIKGTDIHLSLSGFETGIFDVISRIATKGLDGMKFRTGDKVYLMHLLEEVL